MLGIARTGIQWRYLPERFGVWTAVWAQWRRWRANGVWAAAMSRLVAVVRWFHERERSHLWFEVASVGYLAWRAVA